MTAFQKVKSNPTHMGKIFGTYFFLLEKKGEADITRTKINLGSHHLHT